MLDDVSLTRDADHVLDRLVKAKEGLKTSPDQGSYISELRSLGNTDKSSLSPTV
jgi:hypothetical protein